MLKILYVVNVDWFFISHRLALADRALLEGYEVHVACADTGSCEYLKSKGFIVHNIPFSRSGYHFVEELKCLKALYSLIHSIRPSLVHSVTIKPVLYTGVVSRFARHKFPLVCAISGLGYTFSADSWRARVTRFFVEKIYRFALNDVGNKKVIFQNLADEKIVSSFVELKESEIVRIKGSGVDLERYTPSVERSELPVTVVLASRLLKEKGIYEFVQAAKMLSDVHPRLEFLLAGSLDNENPNSISSAEVNGWHQEGVLKYLGESDDIPAVFAMSHIVVLPSYYGEGVPKVLIEAAACGRPVITTHNPGCSDAIIDGETGKLVPIKNASLLADAIYHLAGDSSLRKEMGRKARLLAEREFDLESVVSKHMEIYREMVNK